MKWNRWNDQMVSLLIELYPVETTAHTAAMLEMSVSAVKYKAKELGLGKLATVSYTHLTLPTMMATCRSRWSPYH